MRFFRATAIGGRFYMSDVPDFGPWNESRIIYRTEQELEKIIPRMAATYKILTVPELDGAISSSWDRPGSVTLYVFDGLLESAKNRWEEMKKDLR